MNRTYLSPKTFYSMLIFIILIFYFMPFHWVSILSGIFFGVIIFLSRKKGNLEIHKNKDSGILFSPITGVIESIKKDNGVQVIHIKKSFFEEWGFYMPSCGKVDEIIDIGGKKRLQISNLGDYRDMKRKHIHIKTRTGNIDLCVIDSYFSRFENWIESGDYGFAGARMGLIKGAVNILIFLPSDFSIVMEQGELVLSGKSILAANTVVHS